MANWPTLAIFDLQKLRIWFFNATTKESPGSMDRLKIVGMLSGWALLCLGGCSGTIDIDSVTAANNNTNIKRLSNLYVAFQMKNQMRGPEDEGEFREFIKNYSPKKLKRINVDPNQLDDLFVNERDGEPFKIRLNVEGSVMGSSAPVVFEKTGVGGKRMVGFLNMQQRDVDESEYNDLWDGKFVAPATDRE